MLSISPKLMGDISGGRNYSRIKFLNGLQLCRIIANSRFRVLADDLAVLRINTPQFKGKYYSPSEILPSKVGDTPSSHFTCPGILILALPYFRHLICLQYTY